MKEKADDPKTFACAKCGQTKKRKYQAKRIRVGGKIERTCTLCVKVPTQAAAQ